MFTHKFFSLFYRRSNMLFFGHFVPSRSVNTYIHEDKRCMLFYFAISGLNRQSTLIRYDSLWGTANIDDLLEKFETVLDARYDETTHADVVKPTRKANVGVQANFPSDDESWSPLRHREDRPRANVDRRVEEESCSRQYGGRWRPYQERRRPWTTAAIETTGVP